MDDQIAGAFALLISTGATALLMLATALAKWITAHAEARKRDREDDADE